MCPYFGFQCPIKLCQLFFFLSVTSTNIRCADKHTYVDNANGWNLPYCINEELGSWPKDMLSPRLKGMPPMPTIPMPGRSALEGSPTISQSAGPLGVWATHEQLIQNMFVKWDHKPQRIRIDCTRTYYLKTTKQRMGQLYCSCRTVFPSFLIHNPSLNDVGHFLVVRPSWASLIAFAPGCLVQLPRFCLLRYIPHFCRSSTHCKSALPIFPWPESQNPTRMDWLLLRIQYKLCIILWESKS